MQKSSKCSYKYGDKIIHKKRYLRPEQALESARKLNEDPSKIHYFSAYKCTMCNFFHVGKNNKVKPPKNWDESK
jgi:rubrerythrin